MFYKTSRMTWVANELVSEGFHFFLECMRVPPNWHIWVYVVGSEREAEMYQAWLPDSFSKISRLYAFGPLGLKEYGSATLRCKI